MTGKEKCAQLRDIRNRIAAANGLPETGDTCSHTGPCRGTCPRCEQELHTLSLALEGRRLRGETVALTALCAGLALGLTGCTPQEITSAGTDDLSGAVAYEPASQEEELYVTTGEIAYPYDEPTSPLAGNG